MSSIPDLIKLAYNNRDWELIDQAYNMLTGQRLSNGEYEFSGAEQFERGPDIPSKFQTEERQYPQPPGQSKGKPCRTEPINVKKNKVNVFVDTGVEHSEDIKVDKKLTDRPQVERSRGADLINMICRYCGRQAMVNPSYTNGKYVCDRCIGGKR